jgi:hypothetical protein
VPFSANAIVVDGDLSDLQAAIIGDGSLGNSASEAGNDAENNGFDITNSYVWFDWSNDTLYGGFQTTGVVGDSCSPTGGGLCAVPTYDKLGFDSQETVAMQITLGSLVFDGGSIAAQTGSIIGANVFGIPPLDQSGTAGGFDYAVSGTNDGVEFAISGLIAGGVDFDKFNPLDIAIRFQAGSVSNPGPEDEAFVSATLVPVPASVWLLSSALMGLAAIRRRIKK